MVTLGDHEKGLCLPQIGHRHDEPTGVKIDVTYGPEKQMVDFGTQ